MIGSVLGMAGFLAIGRIAGTQDYRESHLLQVARAAVEGAVAGSFSPPPNDAVPSEPVFVTIEVNGVIRGCRGDLRQRTRTLDEEVALAAKDAAAHDPRYKPLSAKELGHFLVTVTVVDKVTPIVGVDDLRPDEGLVLTSGNRTGVVLPWEGRDPKIRLHWAYLKAKVSEGSSVSLSRLSGKRFRG